MWGSIGNVSSPAIETPLQSAGNLMTQAYALRVLEAGRNAFVTGPPGAGKSYLIRQFVEAARVTKKVAITASTGIAGTHVGGTTLHSWAGLGVRDQYTRKDISDIAGKAWVAARIRNADILVIDEVSMLHTSTFEAADLVCKKVRRSPEPFGGMQVVLCGDFYQLPPVSNEGTTDFIYGCSTWHDLDLAVLYLGEQHRQEDDQLLAILNAIRSGNVDANHVDVLNARMNAVLDDGVVPTRLHTHNVNVDRVNAVELGKLTGKSVFFDMSSTGPEKLTEPLRKSCLAPQRLELKTGASVMFVKNNLSEGYINGTLGTVVGFDEGKVKVRTDRGYEITVDPQSWETEDNKGKTVAAISQIPLRLAWAISIHKSQGMSLSAAEIDLSRAFVEGLGYVALSRVTTLAGIRLLGFNRQSLAVSDVAQRIDLELQAASAEVLEDLVVRDQVRAVREVKLFEC